MALNKLEFYKELYTEHLEEAAFLYEQRLELYLDPEMGWLDLESRNNRYRGNVNKRKCK